MKRNDSLLIFCSLLQLLATIRSNTIRDRNLFATELFKTIATDDEQRDANVIISPIAVQTALGLLYYGAEGRTAAELRRGLHATPHESKSRLAESYHELFHSVVKSKPALEVANKIYSPAELEISKTFRDAARLYFDSDAEQLDFRDEVRAVKSINGWVANRTNGRIAHLLRSLDSDSSLVIVNAAHFKGKWARPFMEEDTAERDFWVSDSRVVRVPTMIADNWHFYADYPALEAKGLELFFENSDLTMWFILPQNRTGLAELERKLQDVDFKELDALWQWQSVTVNLPKFKFEFVADLKPALEQLRIRTMFTEAADFRHLFQNSPIGAHITKFQHKAFIDVNEIGCESAAANVGVGVPMSLPLDPKTFIADHPFVFIIRDKHAVYFVGHIAKF